MNFNYFFNLCKNRQSDIFMKQRNIIQQYVIEQIFKSYRLVNLHPTYD